MSRAVDLLKIQLSPCVILAQSSNWSSKCLTYVLNLGFHAGTLINLFQNKKKNFKNIKPAPTLLRLVKNLVFAPNSTPIQNLSIRSIWLDFFSLNKLHYAIVQGSKWFSQWLFILIFLFWSQKMLFLVSCEQTFLHVLKRSKNLRVKLHAVGVFL